MIRAVMVMNTQGKPRIIRFYYYQPPEKQQELIRTVYSGEIGTSGFICVYIWLRLEFVAAFSFTAVVLNVFDGQRSLCSHVVLSNRPDNASNFVNASSIFGPDCQLVYKHYATLYFVFVYDSAENELAMLDLMQVFVETLDKCFKNVCELDVVYNYSKIHTILDETIFAGQVLETSSTEIMRLLKKYPSNAYLSPLRIERNKGKQIPIRGSLCLANQIA
ncbi:AP-3 complex subunit sigma-like protein [Drosera capensis]